MCSFLSLRFTLFMLNSLPLPNSLIPSIPVDESVSLHGLLRHALLRIIGQYGFVRTCGLRRLVIRPWIRNVMIVMLLLSSCLRPSSMSRLEYAFPWIISLQRIARTTRSPALIPPTVSRFTASPSPCIPSVLSVS